MASPQVTVTGNFIDLTGVALNGYCAFSLNSPTGATEFKIASTGQLIPNRVTTGLGTSFSQLIFGNDVISDLAGNTNTLWNVSCYNASNQAFWDFNYSFTGTNTFNLVSTVPANPPPTLPAPLNAQVANTVYAGPAGGGPGIPIFRSLQTADLPGTVLVTGNGSVPLQTKRIASCTTAATAGSTCTTTVTWTTAYADANYTAVCTIDNPTAVPYVLNTSSKAGASVVVTIANLTAVAASGTINCTAVHD